MASHPVAEHAVDAYLDAVAAQLVGPRSVRAAIIDELRDGLHQAASSHCARGAGRDAAVGTALNEFGPPAATAAAFAGELAGSRARRTVAAYLLTGPVVGMTWLLSFAPSKWWRGPEDVWSAVPAAPMVVLATVVGIGVLAATGRPSRLLRLAQHHVVDGALFVIAGAALSDVLMLAVAAEAAGDSAIVSTTVTVAVVASLIRLGISVVAARRCLQSHRFLAC